MIIRALDINGDWTFGRGKGNFFTQNDAIAQNIETELREFLGDCFMALDRGIDWFNLLGSKDVDTLILSIKTKILNSYGVIRLNEVSISLDKNRHQSLVYSVDTVFNTALTRKVSLQHLLTEDRDVLTTEDGVPLGV